MTSESRFRRTPELEARANELRKQGLYIHQIGEALGVSVATIRRSINGDGRQGGGNTNHAAPDWPEEKKERLKAHVRNGLTMAAAAREMGLTRNMVAGMAHRLGIHVGSARSGYQSPRRGHGWTPEKDQILRDMAGNSHSAQQVAERVGKLRDQVYHRAERLGVHFRSHRVHTAIPSRGLKPPKPTHWVLPREEGIAEAHKYSAQLYARFRESPHQQGRLALAGLRRGVCHYPIDPEGGGPFRYCGLESGRLVYCPEHAARCWANGYTRDGE